MEGGLILGAFNRKALGFFRGGSSAGDVRRGLLKDQSPCELLEPDAVTAPPNKPSVLPNEELLIGSAGTAFLDRLGPFAGVVADNAEAMVAMGWEKTDAANMVHVAVFHAEQGGLSAVVAGLEHAFDRAGTHDREASFPLLGMVPLDAVQVLADRFEVGAWAQGSWTATALA